MSSWECLKNQHFTDGAYALVPIALAHIEPIRIWRNSQMDVLRQAEPISVEQQEDYYARHIFPTMTRTRPPNVLVGFLANGSLIGYGGLVHIAWEHRRAEISFLLDNARTCDEAGYARDFTAFLRLVCEMAFKDLQLHRMFAETYSIRGHHIRVLEAAGFRLEGTMRDHVLINGKYCNSVIHAALNPYA
jgi:RimJ/RimL family protein N-acetyltransferase